MKAVSLGKTKQTKTHANDENPPLVNVVIINQTKKFIAILITAI